MGDGEEGGLDGALWSPYLDIHCTFVVVVEEFCRIIMWASLQNGRWYGHGGGSRVVASGMV